MHLRDAPRDTPNDYRAGYANAMCNGYTKVPTGLISTQYINGFNQGIDQLYHTIPAEAHATIGAVMSMVSSNVDDCQCVVVTQAIPSAARRAVHIISSQWVERKVIRIDTLGQKYDAMRRLRLTYDTRKQNASPA